MPTNIIPAGVFTDPVTRPTDGDVRNAASVEQPFQALTDRTDFMIGQIGGPDGDLEWAYKDGPRSRIVSIDLDDAIDWELRGGGSPQWAWPTNLTSQDFIQSLGNSPGQYELRVPITKYLRHGMVLESVRMLCEPGDVPSSFPTMSLGLYYVAPTLDPLAVAVPVVTGVGSPQASSGHALQVVVLDTGSHAVVRYTGASRSRRYFLRIVGTDSTGGGAGDLDIIYGLGLEFGDVGPGGG